MTKLDLKEAVAHRATWIWPLLAALAVVASAFVGMPGWFALVSAICLVGAVFAAVHHAEVIAGRLGEPVGPLVLAIAVTVIEVGLIASIMLGFGEPKPTLARDTVFAAVMIVCNGIVGASLLSGGVRHHEQNFRLESASAALAVLAALTALTMIVPNVTTTAEGPVFSNSQTAFAAIVSLLLYGAFLFTQTVTHRQSFMPPEGEEFHGHDFEPTLRATWFSFAILLVALTAVVLLAKLLTPPLEQAIAYAGAPKGLVGVVIAAIVLLPEGVASLRAARDNRLQSSLNLALGSALASIALTIPAIGAISIATGYKIELGLPIKEVVLLALTLLISVITLGTGRTTMLQGMVHLSIFASFIFFVIVP